LDSFDRGLCGQVCVQVSVFCGLAFRSLLHLRSLLVCVWWYLSRVVTHGAMISETQQANPGRICREFAAFFEGRETA
jgi:hypothetical protein